MKQKIKSPLGLNPMGVGPKIFKPVFPCLLAGIIAGIFFPEFSHLPINTTYIITRTGYTWLFTGLIFYMAALIQFLREFPKGKLITTGVYSISRNPIYASWIVFIFPGLAMVFNNWIFLLASLVMYIALTRYIKGEELALIRTFGSEYNDYRKRVERVFFIPGYKYL